MARRHDALSGPHFFFERRLPYAPSQTPRSPIQRELVTNIPSRQFAWFLLALAVFVFFWQLGHMDVWSDNEGQRTTPPMEMLRSGDFVIPTINGEDYLAKPPLMYWIIAGVYYISGVISPFTARIPSALCGVLLVMGVYLGMRRVAGEGAARWGALATLTGAYLVETGRTAELEIPLTLAVFAAIAALWIASRPGAPRRQWAWVLGAGVATGAGILIKGPVPFLFLGAAWLAMSVVDAKDPASMLRTAGLWSLIAFALETIIELWRLITEQSPGFPFALALAVAVWVYLVLRYSPETAKPHLYRTLAACGIGVLLALPWGLMVLQRMEPGFIASLFYEEALERTYTASDINRATPFFYLIVLPFMTLPWGLLLPTLTSPRRWAREGLTYRFCLLTGAISVLFFCLIAGKETKYILPAVPFFMLALGSPLSELNNRLLGVNGLNARDWQDRWLQRWMPIAASILGLITVAGAVYLAVEPPRMTVLLQAATLLGAAAVAGVFYWRATAKRLTAIFAMTLAVLMAGVLLRADYYSGERSGKAIAKTAGELLRSGYHVDAHFPRFYPHFAFYVRKEMPVELDLADIRRKLNDDAPYFCVIRKSAYDMLMLGEFEEEPQLLMGPETPRGLLLVGNQPLPPAPAE